MLASFNILYFFTNPMEDKNKWMTENSSDTSELQANQMKIGVNY